MRVDYWKLNAITTRHVYPIPKIEDALSRLEGCRYFFIMDMEVGYWQVGMRAEDREQTAFITADGLYQFKVMPFGLTNAPATFQRMMCGAIMMADDGVVRVWRRFLWLGNFLAISTSLSQPCGRGL